jgi:hypothetical protein
VNLLGSYAHGEVECRAVVSSPDSDPALSDGIACDRAGSITPLGAFEFEVQADRGIPLIVGSIAARDYFLEILAAMPKKGVFLIRLCPKKSNSSERNCKRAGNKLMAERRT